MRWCCRSPARTAPALDSLGAASRRRSKAALERQRFDGEAGRARRAFLDDSDGGGGCWWSARAATQARRSAEKLGGNARAAADLGRTQAVIDLSGLDYRRRCAARVALGAALRAWRYDRYRTKLKDKQKPTLERSHHRRRGDGRRSALDQRWAPVSKGVADPRAGHRAGQHHLSRKLRRARPSRSRARPRDRSARPAAMAKLGMGALLGVAQGSVREARLLVLRWNGGAKGARRSPSSARA
jgi:leucyl aminopeptidase